MSLEFLKRNLTEIVSLVMGIMISKIGGLIGGFDIFGAIVFFIEVVYCGGLHGRCSSSYSHSLVAMILGYSTAIFVFWILVCILVYVVRNIMHTIFRIFGKKSN